ncbi:23471_t:CDS:1, partial [Racocetra persica]
TPPAPISIQVWIGIPELLGEVDSEGGMEEPLIELLVVRGLREAIPGQEAFHCKKQASLMLTKLV